jgi:hypothetical protein
MQRSRIVVLLFVSLLATAAQAQVTSLTLFGDPDDFIGQGQTMFLTPSIGNFSAVQNGLNGVSVSYSGGPGFFTTWNLHFAAPDNQLLTVGAYNDAVLFSTEGPGVPGLFITGNGRGCSTITGNFVVQEITYGSLPLGPVESFDAFFVQHCDGSAAAIRGEIRYNAHPFINVSAPSSFSLPIGQTATFTVSAAQVAEPPSTHLGLVAVNLPQGASFLDFGNQTATFTWVPLPNQAGVHTIVFLAEDTAGHIGATGLDITVFAPPPPNDDFDQATVAPALPFSITEDASNASTAPDDPFPTCFPVSEPSVWFAFTPTQDMRLEANTFGSNYGSVLSVYSGTRGSLTPIACNFSSFPGIRVRFDAVAGTTYFFMVSTFFPAAFDNLVFNLLQAPPPLTISPGVNQFGSMDASKGTATISGNASCSEPPLFAFASGQVTQKHGNSTVTGFFNLSLPCGPWSVDLQVPLQLFNGRSADLFTGGKADVMIFVVGASPDDDQLFQANFNVPITFRGKQ